MNRIFKSIIALFLFSLSSKAQTALNFVDNTSPKTVVQCTEILDSILVVGGLAQVHSCDSPSLRFYNLRGSKKDNSFYIKDLFLPCEAIDVQYDNSFYAIGSPPRGDVVGDEHLVLTLVENMYSPVDTIIFPVEYDYPVETIKSLDVNGSKAVLAYNDFISVLDLETKTVEIHETGNKDFLYAYWLNESNIKLISKNGLINFNVTTENEMLVSSISINEVSCFQDTFFLVRDNDVLKVDKEFKIKYTWFNSAVKGIDVTKENVFFLNETEMNSEVSRFNRKDSSVVITNVLPKDKLWEYELEANETGFFIGKTAYQQLSILNSFNNLPDMSIDTFYISNIVKEFGYGYNFDVTVKVKNNSDVEVTSYSIFALFDAGFMCSRSHIFNTVSDKIILNNEEDVFTTSLSSTYKSGDVCLELFAINETQDLNLFDNVLCIPFDRFVAVDDFNNEESYRIKQDTESVTVFSSDKSEKDISLVGIDGSVYEIKSFRTDITILKPKKGFYILKINDRKGLFSKKILWD